MPRKVERLLAVMLLALAIPVAAATPTASPTASPELAQGASALDALAGWRAAEERTYRLAGDGVRAFSCRVRGSAVEEVAGSAADVRLFWRDGQARVTIDSPGLESEKRAGLAAMVESIASLVLPQPPTRSLQGHVVRVLQGDPWLKVGERGFEAVARRTDIEPRITRVAIGAGGLITRERVERQDGQVSEFVHEHDVIGGRFVPVATRGTFRGEPVSVTLEWGTEVAGRPVPTRVVVDQGGHAATFLLSEHVINGPIDPDVLPPLRTVHGLAAGAKP
jgi:hypothetical protein